MDVEQKLACSLDDLIKQDHQKHGGGGGGFRRGNKAQITNFEKRRPRRQPGSAVGGPGGGTHPVSRQAIPEKALSSHIRDVKALNRPAFQKPYMQRPASAVATGKSHGRPRQPNIGVQRYAMAPVATAKQQGLSKKRVRGGRPLAVIPPLTSVPAVSSDSGLPHTAKKRLVTPQRRSIQKRIVARPVIQPQGHLATTRLFPGLRGKLRGPPVTHRGYPVSIVPNTSLSRRQTGLYPRSELGFGNSTYRQTYPSRSAVKINQRFIRTVAPLNRKRAGVPLLGVSSQTSMPSSIIRAMAQGSAGRVDNHHILPSSGVSATPGPSSSSSSSSSYASHPVVGAAAAAAAASTAPQRSGSTLNAVPPAVQQIRIVTELSRVPGPLLAQQRGHTSRWSNAETDDGDAFEASSDPLTDDNEAFGFEAPRVSSGHRRGPSQLAKNMSPSGPKSALHNRRTESMSLAERFAY